LPIHSQQLVNDRQIRINSPADLSAKRAAMIEYIWGDEGLPLNKLPLPVIANDLSPVPNLSNLERVDTLTVELERGIKSYAHHFIPKVKNIRLVILHSGHLSSFNDSDESADVGFGFRRTLDALLGEGYSVLAVYMPRNVVFETSITVSDDGGLAAHNAIFQDPNLRPQKGSPLKYFLEPITAYLNYLTSRAAADSFPVYSDYNIVGLSGGGWAATVYPAIDTRIRSSISIAGSYPLYLRSGAAIGDAEQTLAGFYSIAGYPEIYVMASFGTGRKQTQIYLRRDWCCFSEVHHDPVKAGGLTYDDAVREFESSVREKLIALGDRDVFTVEIDEAVPDHTITWDAIYDTILPELDESRRNIVTINGGELAGRNVWGTPALWMNGGYTPSKFSQMMGTPAILRGRASPFDLFYRTPTNAVARVSRPPMSWSRPRILLDKVLSDPVVASRGAGRFDVVALGPGYRYIHLSSDGAETTTSLVGEVKALGPPVLIAGGGDVLDIFFRGWNGHLYHGRKIGNSAWLIEDAGGTMTGLPSVVVLANGGFRVFVRGANGELWSALRPNGLVGGWDSWVSVSAQTGGGKIFGSPSAFFEGGVTKVYARTPDAKMRAFVLNENTWSATEQACPLCSGSPTAVRTGVFVRFSTGSIAFSPGTGWVELGGALE